MTNYLAIPDRSDYTTYPPFVSPGHQHKMPPPREQPNPIWSGASVLYFLLAFRVCNALLIRTFFQPDEYFQSLEPAWDIAFGPSSGAWITWVRLGRYQSQGKPLTH